MKHINQSHHMFGSNVCLQRITLRLSEMKSRGSFLGEQLLSFRSVKVQIEATPHMEIRGLRDACFK